MGKKKKGKKGKKGKKVEEVKEPSPYANWSLDEMREEIVKKRKQLNYKKLSVAIHFVSQNVFPIPACPLIQFSWRIYEKQNFILQYISHGFSRMV